MKKKNHLDPQILKIRVQKTPTFEKYKALKGPDQEEILTLELTSFLIWIFPIKYKESV